MGMQCAQVYETKSSLYTFGQGSVGSPGLRGTLEAVQVQSALSTRAAHWSTGRGWGLRQAFGLLSERPHL